MSAYTRTSQVIVDFTIAIDVDEEELADALLDALCNELPLDSSFFESCDGTQIWPTPRGANNV